MPAPSFNIAVEVDRKTVAAILGMTPQRVEQLTREGYIARVKRGRYPLDGAVKGYLRFLKELSEAQSKNVSSNRAQNARAAEIELRMAREDRKIVEMTEAAAVLDRVTGDFLQAVGRSPGAHNERPP